MQRGAYRSVQQSLLLFRVPLAAAAALITLSVVGFFALTAILVSAKAQDTPDQARFFAQAVDDILGRLSHLPFVLSIDQLVVDALEQGDGAELNAVFATIAERSGAEFVFLMDASGLTIASSNHLDPTSLVGRSYQFRPYFLDAMAGETGLFYAVGVTTGRPGYFISEPVRDRSGDIRGVVVVKVGLADITRAIEGSNDLLLVTNRQGVVIAATEPTTVYGVLEPLSSAARSALEAQQQFGDRDLFLLDWAAGDARRAALDGVSYIWTQAPTAREDWTVHMLSDLRTLRQEALLYVALGVLAVLAMLIAAGSVRAGRLRAALATSNEARRRLEVEIEDRQRAEADLNTAREALARKTQLEALGHLSASITHELGQPVSAMRNYITAEEIATGALPGDLMPQMSGLVERMQGILDQLRLFGRSTVAPNSAFDVVHSVEAAIHLVAHTAETEGVALTVDLPPGPLRAAGQATRFEQVVVNLLRNAIDANEGQGTVGVQVRARGEDDVVLSVTDDGPGLGGLDLEALRTPFFSTKPSGKGMGLGLAISSQIINEMDATLQASERADGGAVFEVRVPLKESADV